jgi:hypothetical protein
MLNRGVTYTREGEALPKIAYRVILCVRYDGHQVLLRADDGAGRTSSGISIGDGDTQVQWRPALCRLPLVPAFAGCRQDLYGIRRDLHCKTEGIEESLQWHLDFTERYIILGRLHSGTHGLEGAMFRDGVQHCCVVLHHRTPPFMTVTAVCTNTIGMAATK